MLVLKCAADTLAGAVDQSVGGCNMSTLASLTKGTCQVLWTVRECQLDLVTVVHQYAGTKTCSHKLSPHLCFADRCTRIPVLFIFLLIFFF